MVEQEKLKCMAVLRGADGLEVIEETDILSLRKKLRHYPPEALVCVWRGKKCKLRTDLLSGGESLDKPNSDTVI
jgi:hypothetical protein